MNVVSVTRWHGESASVWYVCEAPERDPEAWWTVAAFSTMERGNDACSDAHDFARTLEEAYAHTKRCIEKARRNGKLWTRRGGGLVAVT